MGKNRLDREVERIENRRALLDRIAESQESGETNDWEDEFLDSIYDQVERGYDLSDRQMEKLEEIEDEIAFGRD